MFIPRRVKARPNPSEWADDELMTLQEAAALLWPDGMPLSASSLRSAQKSRALEVIVIARKCLVTKEAIRRMLETAARPARGAGATK